MQIAIIGAGNIGQAIAGGFIRNKAVEPEKLIVSDVCEASLAAIQKIDSNITTTKNNKEAAAKASMLILAVKPWLVQAVLFDIAKEISDDKIIVSCAAGIDFDFLSHTIDKQIALFRVMPNTAISIGESMTLIASQDTSKAQDDFVVSLFSKLGKALLISDNLMGAATSVASCGIAYALRYLRASTVGAVELGFTPETASLLVAQTMKGAAALMLTNQTHPEIEIDKVTTPGGWTIKGLNEMEAHGFSNAVIKGLKANRNS